MFWGGHFFFFFFQRKSADPRLIPMPAEQQDSASQFSFLSAQSESLSPVSTTKELVQ